MTKDDFLVAVKLTTGIEIKLGHQYYFGSKIGFIRPVEFMIDGIMYEYIHFNHITKKQDVFKSFLSFYQIIDCVNNIREIFSRKSHVVGGVDVFQPNQYFKTVN